MTGFGERVSALLDTYTKCLNLLNAFKKEYSSDAEFSDGASSVTHSRLSSSIRSDRAQVKHAYSARLSQTGRRLEKGDSRSKNVLRRILDNLKAVIRKLLDSVNGRPVIDYESLMSLSNSSRINAIREMDQLSHRLASNSSSSSVVRSRRKSGGSVSSSKHSSRSSSSTTAPASDRGKTIRKRSPSAKPKSQQKTQISDAPVRDQPERSNRIRSKAVKDTKRNDSRGSNSARSTPTPSGDRTRDPRIATRISAVSFSSGSTKLGEIPHRRSRLHRSSAESGFDDYNIRVAYPLQAYRPPPKEKEGFLKRLFSS